MLTKAATLEVDQVFLDLEDAVAPSEKTDDTRRRIADALRDQPWKARTKAVRVNAVSTPWCHRDIITVVELAGVDVLQVGRVEHQRDEQRHAEDRHRADRLVHVSFTTWVVSLSSSPSSP